MSRMLESYLPKHVNRGPWINAWTLFRLRERAENSRFLLPVCSIDHHYDDLIASSHLHLPPLFHEAMAEGLQSRMIDQILNCFPVYGDRQGNERRVAIVEHRRGTGQRSGTTKSEILAFSVDTAVEEHGPHLPLGTDTIQSYSVLQALANSHEELELVQPLEYGQLTWGLPFGFSIDLTARLLTQYVKGYVNALLDSRQPRAIYVVDVHGSITHRQAIVEGLKASRCDRWAFRWLHEPLAEFASARGDQHAGGVETALVEHASSDLIDRDWFPSRESEIAERSMTLEKAVELTPILTAFRDYVSEHSSNGIVGDIRNYHTLDAQLMFDRMLNIAKSDVASMLKDDNSTSTDAGKNFW